jgi:hypothetical protein
MFEKYHNTLSALFLSLYRRGDFRGQRVGPDAARYVVLVPGFFGFHRGYQKKREDISGKVNHS